jgi:hypothetical protein
MDAGTQAVPCNSIGVDAPMYNEAREVQIVKVANGFVCRVGCKTFVAKTWAELSKCLAEYWKDPRKAEKKYVQK